MTNPAPRSDSTNHSGSGTGTPRSWAARRTSHSRRRPAGASTPSGSRRSTHARRASPTMRSKDHSSREAPPIRGLKSSMRTPAPRCSSTTAASSSRSSSGSVKMRGRVVTSEGGTTVADRWLSDEELRELSRPTMDRAIDAIDAGEPERARVLCEDMKHEWLMLHDLMAESVLGLISFVQDRLGDEGVAEAWTQCTERGWKRHHDAINALPRRQLVYLLAATWRGPPGSRLRGEAGGLSIYPGQQRGQLAHDP